MNPETIQSTLASLRKAGSIFGVLFIQDGETLFSDLAYTRDRVTEFTEILDDIGYYFDQERREPDTLAFSYDGGNLVILMQDGLRLVVLHHKADEVDFIASAGGAFIKDFKISKSVQEFTENGAIEMPKSVSAPARDAEPNRKVEPTSPISPA
jgi:hypothetical protein